MKNSVLKYHGIVEMMPHLSKTPPVLIILMILKLMIMAPSVIMAARVNSLSWMMTVKCLIDDPKDPKPGEYKLTRTYWVHSSTKAFKRRTITLQDHVGELWSVIILQYSNTGAEEDVKVEPHKNAKKSIQPFYATATSTKQHISDKAKTPLGPSSIYDELYEEEGGIIDSASFAELPRGKSGK